MIFMLMLATSLRKGNGIDTYSAGGGGLSPSTWYFLSCRLGLVYRMMLWGKGGLVLCKLRTDTSRSESVGALPGLPVQPSPSSCCPTPRQLCTQPYSRDGALTAETHTRPRGRDGGASAPKVESLLPCGEDPKKHRLRAAGRDAKFSNKSTY